MKIIKIKWTHLEMCILVKCLWWNNVEAHREHIVGKANSDTE